MKTQQEILSFLELLEPKLKNFPPTMTQTVKLEYGDDPFYVLISCLLSLRARDTVTIHVVRELFKRVHSPQDLVNMDMQTLEKIIYKTGFYKRKAQSLKHVAFELINRFNGNVPKTESELLSIKGIGRKTANLVLAESFGIPAICVDTHVHALANQLGWVKTKTPVQTERALQKIVPKDHWISLNRLLVVWGQNKKNVFWG